LIRRKIRKHTYLIIIGLLLFFSYGCAGYGKITAKPWGETVTVGELAKTSEKYDVSYSDQWPTAYPACFIFDPKDDGRTLIGDTWIRIEDPERIPELISWISSFSRSYPTVQRVFGPDDQLYGFLYCDSDYRTVAKVVDQNTMYVYRPFKAWSDR